MNKFARMIVAASLLSAASTAIAGGGYGHHGGHFGLGHWSNHVGLHYGYHGRASDVLGVIAGGIILGSILDYAFSPRHHHVEYRGNRRHRSPRRFHEPAGVFYDSPRPVYREVVTRREVRHRRPLPQQTHLHRDRHGNCFEISYGVDGSERRAERPRSDCAW